MPDTRLYYFDVLPVHPPPEPLESYTSYLTRLAEANRIQSIFSLASTFSMKVKTTRSLKDNIPPSLQKQQTAMSCSEETLLATTFFHLGRKFGRVSTQPLSYFLSDSIARVLRYCPGCLASRPYYPLTWRFLHLQGCIEHNCYLLNECAHCGNSIPIIADPFKIGTCPTCRGNLQLCVSKPLSGKEYEITLMTTRELEFLLVPQQWETPTIDRVRRVGLYLAHLRQERRVDVAEVARHIGTTERGVYRIERMIEPYSSPFIRYIKYARYLNVSLRDAFEIVAQQKDQYDLVKRRSTPPSIDEIVEQVQRAIELLESRHEPVTQRAVSEIIQVDGFRLYDSQVIDILVRSSIQSLPFSRKRTELHCEEWLRKAQQAVEQLENCGEEVTQEKICERMGVTRGILPHYPLVKSLIDQSVARYQKRMEDELVARVESSITHLEAHGKPVTQAAISKLVGVHRNTLRRNARVRSLLEQFERLNHHHTKQFLLRENELIAKLEVAIKKLEISGLQITQQAVCEMAGIQLSALRNYTRAKILLVNSVKRHPALLLEEFLSSDEELVVKVERAIQQLEAHGEPVTKKAVAKIVGIPPDTLNHYPQLSTLLEQIEQMRRLYLSEQARIHQEMLIAKVEEAVWQLETLGQLVTPQAISRVVDVPISTLYNYPEVASVLKRVVRENQSKYFAAKRQAHETELVAEVLKALQQLEGTGKRFSATTIARAIHVSLGTLKKYPKVKAILERITRRDRMVNNVV